MARRAERLIVREMGDEVMVYDLDTNAVHCLAGPTAAVWRAVELHASIPGIAKAADVEERVVTQALAELENLRLLESPVTGFSRRTMLRGAVIGGGAIVALPAIETILAPSALAACSNATQRATSALSDAWVAARATNPGTNPDGGYTFGYSTTTTTPTDNETLTAFGSAQWQNSPTKKWLHPSDVNAWIGDASGSSSALRFQSDHGSSSSTTSNFIVGVSYLVPANSSTATLNYSFTNDDNSKTVDLYAGPLGNVVKVATINAGATFTPAAAPQVVCAATDQTFVWYLATTPTQNNQTIMVTPSITVSYA